MMSLFDCHCQNFICVGTMAAGLNKNSLFYNQTNSLSFAVISRERSEWAQCYSRNEKGREKTRNSVSYRTELDGP